MMKILKKSDLQKGKQKGPGVQEKPQADEKVAQINVA